VRGLCCGETHDLTLDDGCELCRIPVPRGDDHKRHLVRVASPEIPGVFRPFFHHDCVHNQLRAIVGRVAGPVVKPSTTGLSLLSCAAAKVGRLLPLTSANPLEDMPKRYSGGKRKRYEQALSDLQISGLFPKDAYCKMFVKAERVDGLAKRNPDPRAIQFRGPKYCVALAAFLHPIEHHLYLSDTFSAGVPKTRNIAKGLNSVDRAELLVQKLGHFQDPVVFSIDASRFDKHMTEDLLKVEHSVYACSNASPEFLDLLSKQIRNVCFSSLGIKYKVLGRRMSGDMNTACGNCVIMLTMLLAYCDLVLGLRRWDSLDDGDDCLLIVEGRDVDLVSSTLGPEFLNFGMEMKVDVPTRCVHEVVFCQSSVVEYQPQRFKFVRDYRAVVSKALCGIRHWDNHTYRRRVLRAIGTCELVLNLSVPVLQAFACAVLRNAGAGEVDLTYAPDGLRARAARDGRALGIELTRLAPRPIQDVARGSFEKAFGIDAAEQRSLESFFESWTFPIEGLHLWGEEWDVTQWLPTFSRVEVSLYRQDVA
jgi:hypothetical protein